LEKVNQRLKVILRKKLTLPLPRKRAKEGRKEGALGVFQGLRTGKRRKKRADRGNLALELGKEKGEAKVFVFSEKRGKKYQKESESKEERGPTFQIDWRPGEGQEV